MSDADEQNESEIVPLLDELRQVRQRVQEKSAQPVVTEQSGYQIVRELRRGGQGIVYEAIQRSTGRRVALKVLRQSGFRNHREVLRFSREVDVLAGLHHRSIVTLFDTGELNGEPYYAMEFIDGRPLTSVPELQVPDSPAGYAVRQAHIRQVVSTFVVVCDAVACFQRNGLIHRDLKPDNILVDREGLPHVVDFGLARIAEAEGDPNESRVSRSAFTMTGEFLGTPAYASPEQAIGDPRAVDIRSDVYSLGVILFELITGQLPVSMTGPITAVLQRIAEHEPVRPSSINRIIDHDLDSIVLKSLSKDPDRRYQSAAEVAADIRRWLNGQPITARSDSTWYVIRKSLRRHKLAVVATAGFMVLVSAASVISFVLWRQAVHERNVAQAEAYVASLYGANAAQKEHRTQDALDLLLRPEERLRGWEWNYVHSRIDHSFRTNSLFEESVDSCAWSSDQQWLALIDTGGQLRIHRVADGTPLTLPAELQYSKPSHVAFRPGHAELLIVEGSGRIRLFSLNRSDWTEVIGVPSGQPVAAAFDNSGLFLAIGLQNTTQDCIVWVRSMTSQEMVRTLPIPWPVRAVAVCYGAPSSGVATVAVGGEFVEIYDLTDGQRISRFSASDKSSPRTSDIATSDTSDGTVTCLAYSDDNALIAAGYTHGTALLADYRVGAIVQKLSGHMGPVSCVAFSADSQKLLTGSHDTVTRLWDVGTGQPESVWHGHIDWVRGTNFVAGDEVASVSVRGELKRFRLGFTAEDRRLDHHSSVVTGASFIRSGEKLLSASLDGSLQMIDVSNGRKISSPISGSTSVTALAVDRQNSVVAGGLVDGTVQLFHCGDQRSSELILDQTFQEDSSISCVALSSENSKLAVGLESGEIILRSTSVQPPETDLTIRHHTQPVRFLGFVNNGTSLVSEDETNLKISDVSTGEIRHLLNRAPSRYFAPVAVHPSDELIVAGDSSGKISAWDPVTGREQPPFLWHASSVTALCFCTDGTRLISAARDGSIKIWDVARRTEVFALPSVQGFVTRLDFSPDQKRIAAGLYDGSVILFEAVSARDRDSERRQANSRDQ